MFEIGKKYYLGGIGNIMGNEKCVITGNISTGYISRPDIGEDMIPVDLKIFGKGKMGEYIEYLGKPHEQ